MVGKRPNKSKNTNENSEGAVALRPTTGAPALAGAEAARLVEAQANRTRFLLAQSDQNDWRTPRKFLDAARAVMGAIDLDPASGAEANVTVKAAKFYTEADNGLERPWKGRVWLNPPYGGEARLFTDRLLKEYQIGNVSAACLLVNSHPTETKWFQELFAYPVCFVAGRIDFGGPSRDVSTSSTHGSAVVYLGEQEGKFVKSFPHSDGLLFPRGAARGATKPSPLPTGTLHDRRDPVSAC